MINKIITGVLICMCAVLVWQLVDVKTNQAHLLARAFKTKSPDTDSRLAQTTNSLTEASIDNGNNAHYRTLEDRMTNIESLLAQVADELTVLRKKEARDENPQNDLPQLGASGTKTRREPKESKAESLARFDTVIDQTRDDDVLWSSTTTAMIEEKVAAHPVLKKAESLSVDCASKLCRIEMYVPNSLDAFQQQEFQWIMLQAFAQELPTGTYDYANQADGSRKLVYYLARSGHALPRKGE